MTEERTGSPGGGRPRAPFDRDVAVLLALAAVALLLHLVSNRGYGYFRDELYYLACGEHLDWGYVDHPPFVALVARMSRALLGDSLPAIRFVPAVASAALVFLTGLLARELGGSRFSQCLAAICAVVAPHYLFVGNYLSMNVFDELFWAAGAFLLTRLIKRDDPRLWVPFGAVAGAGLMNKHSMLFFGFGVAVGLLLTPQRRHLSSRWLWAGLLVAGAIFLPNIIWEVRHGWPTLEFMQNAQRLKNYQASPFEFFLGQVLEMHPFTLPVWLLGLGYFLLSNNGRRYRLLGLAYAAIFALLAIQKAKAYYLAPAYPMLLAGGGVAVGRFIEGAPAGGAGRRRGWMKPAVLAPLILGGALTAPMVLPVLPVETFIRYQALFGGAGEVREERHRMGRLPQRYADMFGWEEMAATVARVYQALPADEQARCGIFTSNYGEAGAIDFFGKRYGLPKALSGHNNYYLWGPGVRPVEIVITIGESEEDVKKSFEQVSLAATFRNENVMPYEDDLPIYVGRRPRAPIDAIWPRTKKFV